MNEWMNLVNMIDFHEIMFSLIFVFMLYLLFTFNHGVVFYTIPTHIVYEFASIYPYQISILCFVSMKVYLVLQVLIYQTCQLVWGSNQCSEYGSERINNYMFKFQLIKYS
jgi:hypothetical protein